MNRTSNTALVFFLSVLLAACGGGGGGGGGGGPTTAGIDGTGVTGGRDIIAAGTVSGFGSVIVNGVRFETSSTSFTIDGNPGTQDDLDVGDVIVVRGSLDDNGTSGTADAIVFDDLVEGRIAAASINQQAGSLVVLGQTVLVTADTSFDDLIQPPSLAGLSDGDTVEVSGFRASDGSIRATRIELKPFGPEFEVTGIVSNLDGVGFSFDINALSVDYSGALIEDFSGGIIEPGDLVEVKGSTFGAGGELIATRVEFKGDDVSGDNGDRVELEGFITRFVDTTDFDVAGLPVTTTAQTVYEGGVAGDLGLDVKVEVEGDLSSAGVLVASKVDIRRASAVRAVAVIDSVNTANDTFVVLGITVRTDVLTRIEDKSSQDVSPFSADNLLAGDYVEVRGSELPAGSGQILASRVEREDLDTETELQGFVTADDGIELVILGVTISTNGGTQYRDEDEIPISATEFFNRVDVGSLVDVNGTEIGPQAISADELEIEIE